MVYNALTVDVEDYFHVAAFSKQIDPASWDSFPLRVESNTHRLLDLFAQYNTKATFFVLGWVAERCPNLVREIVDKAMRSLVMGILISLSICRIQLFFVRKPFVLKSA
ncbi:MAG: polysaccharide deacetylase family protein [Candidatus Competibacter denitrificans]